MSSEKHTWFGSVWQNLPAAIAEFPLMTAGEQTKLSWARRVETLDDVPPSFRTTVAALVTETGSLPYLILAPSYAAFIVHTTEKLVCGLDDEVRVYELSGGEVRLTAFCYADVSAVEVGCVLLKSWLTITGKNTCGVETRITIKFNTVTDYLFLPIIGKLRRARAAADLQQHEAEQAKFNYLAHDFYKFMNVAKKSILPGEEVVGAVMQAELRTPVVTLFGHAYTRLKAPAHILVRTDRELIVAVEEKQEAWSGSHKYGSIRTYIPLAKIVAADLTAGAPYLRMSIHLVGGEQIDLDFAAEQEPDLRRLVPLRPL
ncbi:MAG: hypothetical protein U0X20_27820 [Caldilineaceae bacterium]